MHKRDIGIASFIKKELLDLRERCATRAQVSKLDEAQEAADQAEEDANLKAQAAAKRAAGVFSYPA